MTTDAKGPTKALPPVFVIRHPKWAGAYARLDTDPKADWANFGQVGYVCGRYADLFSEASHVYAETGLTPREMMADISFLLGRAMQAERCSFSSDGRDCGASSNSIVGIAYGSVPLVKQEMPSDLSDLNACRRMWEKLPAHRKCGDALNAMEKAKKPSPPRRRGRNHERGETGGR